MVRSALLEQWEQTWVCNLTWHRQSTHIIHCAHWWRSAWCVLQPRFEQMHLLLATADTAAASEVFSLWCTWRHEAIASQLCPVDGPFSVVMLGRDLCLFLLLLGQCMHPCDQGVLTMKRRSLVSRASAQGSTPPWSPTLFLSTKAFSPALSSRVETSQFQ